MGFIFTSVSFVLPIEQIVRPVPGDENLLAFRYDFELEGKAVEDQVITETDDGDLIIDGYAAVFEGIDRENENFTDGAFQRGINDFLTGQAALCYHHKHDKVLGKVLDLREEQGKGLRMKARIDGAIKSHPELGTIYQQIKKGTINALSVGGFFRRKLTENGWRISDCDFTEISVTPVPVHPGTNFAVVAGKALASDLEVPDNVPNPKVPQDEIRDEDFFTIQMAVETLSRVFEQLSKRGTKQEDSAPEPEAALA